MNETKVLRPHPEAGASNDHADAVALARHVPATTGTDGPTHRVAARRAGRRAWLPIASLVLAVAGLTVAVTAIATDDAGPGTPAPPSTLAPTVPSRGSSGLVLAPAEDCRPRRLTFVPC